MANEQSIVSDLQGRFPVLADSLKIARDRRIWCEAPLPQFRDIFRCAAQQLNFVQLAAITGLDEGERLALLYHLSRLDGTMLTVRTVLPKDSPQIESVAEFFPGCVLYERELIDLLGVKVEGLPEGSRYPLLDDWPEGQYPLRKDWTVEMLEVAPAKQPETGD